MTDGTSYLRADLPDRAPPTPPATRALSSLGIVAGIGAFVSASCCVIPIALSAIGLSTAAVAGIQGLLVYRLWFLAIAMVVVAFGWAIFVIGEVRRRRSDVCAPCAGRTRRWPVVSALALATGLTAVAAAWPRFEPGVMRFLFELQGIA